MADAGSRIPATQRKGDDRHNENKELLGSTLAKEIGNRQTREGNKNCDVKKSSHVTAKFKH